MEDFKGENAVQPNITGLIMVICFMLTVVFIGIIAVNDHDKIKSIQVAEALDQQEIKTLQSHTDMLAKAVKAVAYEAEVLTEAVKQK